MCIYIYTYTYIYIYIYTRIRIYIYIYTSTRDMATVTFQTHMRLGCVDAANGSGICNIHVAYITRNSSDISMYLKTAIYMVDRHIVYL